MLETNLTYQISIIHLGIFSRTWDVEPKGLDDCIVFGYFESSFTPYIRRKILTFWTDIMLDWYKVVSHDGYRKRDQIGPRIDTKLVYGWSPKFAEADELYTKICKSSNTVEWTSSQLYEIVPLGQSWKDFKIWYHRPTSIIGTYCAPAGRNIWNWWYHRKKHHFESSTWLSISLLTHWTIAGHVMKLA